MSFPTMEKQQMRTLRWTLTGVVLVLVSCGGGSSSIEKDPILDWNVSAAFVDAWTPTIWAAAGYCWGADQKVIMDIIIEMNPFLDPTNLKQNQIIVLPRGNSRNEFNRTRRYKVGDTGPGGGIIVYVDVVGFNNSHGGDTSIGVMCLTGTCHYLEMALTDLEGQYSWDDAIVASKSYFTVPAGYWQLPSKDALDLIYKFSTSGVGGFSTGNYWSSSDSGGEYAWFQYFPYGGQSDDFKGKPSYVRPVRAF